MQPDITIFGGKYRIEKRIGGGSFGEVYLGKNLIMFILNST